MNTSLNDTADYYYTFGKNFGDVLKKSCTLIGPRPVNVFRTKQKREIDVPWKDIAGFRDRAIHDYYNVDLESYGSL